MADLWDCMQSAMDAGEMDRERGTIAQRQYRELFDTYRKAMPEASAAAQAEAAVKEAARKAATKRRHQTLAQLQRMTVNQAYVENAADPAGAIKALLVKSREDGFGVMNVENQQEAIAKQLLGMIPEFLRRHSRDLFGRVRDRARVENVVRELHGEATGDAMAKRLAEAVSAMFERARSLFNAHGGDIGKLDDYGLPHSHDPQKIRAAGFEAWRDAIHDRLDWARIVDLRTGRPFAGRPGESPDRAATEAMLRDIYNGVTTYGWDDRAPSLTPGGRALGSQRAESRVLHFRDGSAWLEYNAAFGEADPFTAIVRHAQGMARDIALMRVLGPNPKAGLEHMVQVATRRAETTLDEKMRGEVESMAAQSRAILGHLTGEANVPSNHWYAAALAGTRQLLQTAQLGGAVLSSVTDLWTVRMAAKHIGMNGRGVWGRQMQLIASSATRDTAARMGYVADRLIDIGSAQARFVGDVWSPEITSIISSAVLRASGLSGWTDISRLAFKMEFSGLLADNAGRALDDVDAPLRDLLRRRGISAEDWATFSDPELLFRAETGETFLAPSFWREAALARGMPSAEVENLAIRMAAILEEELNAAVPSTALEGRARLISDARPGTFAGELVRSGLMYKSFGISVAMTQYRRVASMGTAASKARYVAEMMAGLTLLGGLAVQLKEMAKGRDPRPMDDAAFWGAAFFQGGGLGIFGDFLVAETSRTGGGLAETLSGPVVGLGGDITRAGQSNISRVLEGKDPLIGRDVANLARRYNPLASLWYTRVAMDRMIWDQMQRYLDPEAEAQWRRAVRRHQRDFGNAEWWRRGEMLPNRSPDIAAAAGDPR